MKYLFNITKYTNIVYNNVFKNVLIFGIINILCSSCLWNQSTLNQITKEDQTCSVNNSRALEYYNKYGKNNNKITVSSGNREQFVKKAFELLSNVPQEYLESVLVKRNISIQITPNNDNGDTTVMDTSPPYPISMITGLDSLPHEFGHASEEIAWKKHSDFSSALTKASNAAFEKYNDKYSWYLETHVNSSSFLRDRETFAELFDTWYCSKAARNLLKTDMPDIYSFAQKYLLPPLDETDTDEDNNNNNNNNNSSSSSSNSSKVNDENSSSSNEYEDYEYDDDYDYSW